MVQHEVSATFPARTRRTTGAIASMAWALSPWLAMVVVLGLGAFLRVWQIDGVGYNSDEAVYAGQAAAIANDPTLQQFFPVFRAHPLLFQTIVAVGFLSGVSDLYGRLVSMAFGVATIYVVYLLGSQLYGRGVGVFSALVLALMPYHVVVTRQVLLDGPMTFFATLALYLVARYSKTERPIWLHAAGGALGLMFLSKETGIVLLGSLYAFFALSASIRVRVRDLAVAMITMAVVIAPFPLTMALAGRTSTGQQYLAWQLFRRPNHDFAFYPTVVPPAIGVLVIVAAVLGLWLLRRRWSWRETLLVTWIVVPTLYFQLWPVKGFQYLLPVAPAIAVLAARTLVRGMAGFDLGFLRWRMRGTWLGLFAGALVTATLVTASWQSVQPSTSDSFLAGSGGIPGGREAGAWVRENVPENARLLALGPSMANIIQFYGHRKAYGLSVSPNPLHRNPSYEAVSNPDRAIRDNEIQYLVWDSFSAGRSSFFSEGLLRYVDKYHGRAVHTETVTVIGPDGTPVEKPVIIFYEVRP